MFAIGVEYLFSCVLELIQKHANKEQTFQLRGQWFAVPPTAWSTKRDLKISVGVGAGNKDAMLAQLQGMFAAQMQTMPLGISTPQTLYATALEIAKLQGFSSPEKFWADPSKQPPQQPQPPLPLLIEQAKQQGEAQKTQFEAQVEAQKTQAELGFEKWKADQELAMERFKAELDAQTKIAIEQIRTGTQKEVKAAELMSVAEKEGRKHDLEKSKYVSDKQYDDSVLTMIQQFTAALEGMRNIVEMANAGKVAAVQKIRGPDGRMVGARVVRGNGEAEDIPIQ
jgi:hypothetical protein